jgi:hypothetical protein
MITTVTKKVVSVFVRSCAAREMQYRSVLEKRCTCDEILCGGSNLRRLAEYFSPNPGRGTLGRRIEKFVGYLRNNEDDVQKLLQETKKLRIVSSVDSNYTTDKRTVSVSGALHSLGGMITGGCARLSQMSLSSCQAGPKHGYGFTKRSCFSRCC